MTEDSIVTIRCRNWEEEPDICEYDCGIDVSPEEATSSRWIRLVMDLKPEWFIVLRSCPEHDIHWDPYCSIHCFERVHSRHEHAGDS